jgi:hypothetical protein
MKVSKFITICDDFRNHEFEVSVDVDADDIRCAITEDKENEQGVLRSFGDFIRYSQAVPDEIYAGFNDKQREVIGGHLETVLAKVRVIV